MINVYPCPISKNIYFGLIISLCNQSHWPVSFQSHHVDISKKLHSTQAGWDSRVPVGCQNDLADVEKQKSKRGPLQ
jgi:hypothetical protein